jgi:hypothetical protein
VKLYGIYPKIFVGHTLKFPGRMSQKCEISKIMATILDKEFRGEL